MKKAFLILVFTVSIASFFSACSGTNNNSNEQTVKVEYTCPMHPEVIKAEPGKCPKCGMDLVEKKVEEIKDSTNHEGHKHSM